MDPKVKLIGAIVVAAGALGVAGWLGYTSLGGGRTVRSASDADRAAQAAEAGEARPGEDGGERQIQRGGPPPGWVQEEAERSYDTGGYPSAGDAVESFDAGAADLAIRAEQDGALGTLGIAPRRGLIETWRAFIRPLITGDAQGFESAILSMGGDVGEPGEDGGTRATALHDRLSGFLHGARVDLAAAEIIERDPTQRGEVPMGAPMPAGGGGQGGSRGAGIPIMVEVSTSVDDASGEQSETRMMVIPLTAVFPDAAERAMEGAKTVEVWAPAKLAGGRGSSGDIGPSGYFVLDEQTGQWQPVALRIALASEAATGQLNEMMRARRRAQD